jgi:hypothetical protein
MPPYNNKTTHDPGEFRHKIQFMQQVSTPNGSGGTSVAPVLAFATRAKKKPINPGSTIAMEAGASVQNGDTNFIIRFKSGTPTKSMWILEGAVKYTISTIIVEDDPANYYRIVAIRNENYG